MNSVRFFSLQPTATLVASFNAPGGWEHTKLLKFNKKKIKNSFWFFWTIERCYARAQKNVWTFGMAPEVFFKELGERYFFHLFCSAWKKKEGSFRFFLNKLQNGETRNNKKGRDFASGHIDDILFII